jgi:hypothetical protein
MTSKIQSVLAPVSSPLQKGEGPGERSLLLLCALILTLSACAQQGGGLLQPTPKQIIAGKNTIVPSAAALTMEATNFCNAQAQVDYASLVLYCEGKTPALPLSISTTYQTEANQFSCQVYGYTNASNQLIVPQTVTLGNCPTGVAPAPVAAPTGAPSVKTSEIDRAEISSALQKEEGPGERSRATSERGMDTENNG